MKRASLEQLSATRARKGVVRRVFSGERATLAFTTLDPGHTPHPHSHEHEQLVYIVSGSVRFTVGEEQTEAGPGDLILVPPNVEHFAEVIGEQPCLDLSVFSPRRDDYVAEAEA